MSFVANFSCSQTPGSPSQVTFTDTSTGSDGAIASRRVYVQINSGEYLVEDGTTTEYEVWPLPLGTAITLDLLNKDYGCRVVVQWLNSGGTILYDATNYYGFNCYNEDFDYETTQAVAANQLLMNDANFWGNKDLIRTYIDSGDNAIARAADINACQQCYDLATELKTNAQYYFNENS